MTSLVSWLSVDSRAPSALYIATDSRFSWGVGESTWDFGRKVFASRHRPEVFGYVGHVLFPCVVLGQLADAVADDGSADAQGRFDLTQRLLAEAMSAYPDQRSEFSIAYGIREGTGVGSTFRLFSVRWRVGTGWDAQEVDVPRESGTALVWGSGSGIVEDRVRRWTRSMGERTSRGVFSAFCDAVESGEDPKSGGAPQLVALTREGNGRSLGFVSQQGAYHLGLPVHPEVGSLGVDEWRNRRFERCTVKGDLVAGAQPQPAPRDLSRP